MTEQATIAFPKMKRTFLPEDLSIHSWDDIATYFEELKNREINNVEDLHQWLLNRSELESIMEEDGAWRYIHMTCDTTSKEYTDAFNFFVSEIEPKASEYQNEYNKKLVASPYLKELDQEKYFIYLRGIQKDLEIFREENIPLQTQIHTDSQKYGSISGAMTIEVDGKELTMQQASKYLKSNDRNVRKDVYDKIQARRGQDKTTMDDLFTLLVALRHKVAVNAGFKNFRDYSFEAMGRFDYNVEDCYNFHNAVAKEIVPLVEALDRKKQEKLGVDTLHPWDLDAETSNKAPLSPFETGEELIDKCISCFSKLHPYFGQCIETMKAMKYVDLESRKGKAPGGYNYPLSESGVPFIFMNAAGTFRDMITMVHEGGHAIHSFLTRDLELDGFKHAPSEVAELASMSMELLSSAAWDAFFSDPEDIKRGKRDHLEKIIRILPWIASVDKFQHWIYENPEHTVEERTKTWSNIMKEFGSSVVDWSGYEEPRSRSWHNQLHIFEIPFYYIEYGFAQLGAIAVWRNSLKDQAKALEEYQNALKLGYTKSIPEIYKTAGIHFDFSQAYIKELATFLGDELKKLD